QAGRAVARWDDRIWWNQDRLTATTGWKHSVLYLADLDLAPDAHVDMASIDLDALTLGRVETSLDIDVLGGGLRADISYAPEGPALDGALTIWNIDLEQGRVAAVWGQTARGYVT